jgi:hypothetical protein
MRLALSNGPNRTDVSHPLTGRRKDPVSEICSLEYRTMDKSRNRVIPSIARPISDSRLHTFWNMQCTYSCSSQKRNLPLSQRREGVQRRKDKAALTVIFGSG